MDSARHTWDAARTVLEPDLTYVALAALAFVGIVLLLARPSGLFSGGGRGRLPKHFVVKDIPSTDIPSGAKRPLDFLTKKLSSLGFRVADLPVRVPALQSFGYRLVLVPFVHESESTFFLMGIEQHLLPKTELMLHIITPLTEGRRVETTTLPALQNLAQPPRVESRVVLDADSVEEIWSRHRLALQTHERCERAPVSADQWRQYAAQTYEGWLQSGVRAQRLMLEADGETYRIRSRPKSFI
jgi:hypothetical protein